MVALRQGKSLHPIPTGHVLVIMITATVAQMYEHGPIMLCYLDYPDASRVSADFCVSTGVTSTDFFDAVEGKMWESPSSLKKGLAESSGGMHTKYDSGVYMAIHLSKLRSP